MISRCPRNKYEYDVASTRKNCNQYNATDCLQLHYHCVLNENATGLVEVCAASRFIFCKIYSVSYIILNSVFQMVIFFVFWSIWDMHWWYFYLQLEDARHSATMFRALEIATYETVPIQILLVHNITIQLTPICVNRFAWIFALCGISKKKKKKRTSCSALCIKSMI